MSQARDAKSDSWSSMWRFLLEARKVSVRGLHSWRGAIHPKPPSSQNISLFHLQVHLWSEPRSSPLTHRSPAVSPVQKNALRSQPSTLTRRGMALALGINQDEYTSKLGDCCVTFQWILAFGGLSGIWWYLYDVSVTEIWKRRPHTIQTNSWVISFVHRYNNSIMFTSP